MSAYQLITAPVIEPITRSEAKMQLDIPSSETYFDSLIDSLITSSRMTVEQLTYRGLLTQTWDLWIDEADFLGDIVEISKVPIQSISYVKYYDSTNTLTTLSTDNYRTDLVSSNSPARIQFINKPNVYNRINAVVIRFVCGWSSAAAIPEPIKQAQKLILRHLYDNRSDVVTGGKPATIPMGAQYLLNPYSLNWFYKSV